MRTPFHLLITLVLSSSVLFACKDEEPAKPTDTTPNPVPVADTFIRGADFSYVPEIEDVPVAFMNNGVQEDPLTTFKSYGGNTIRLRLWHTPAGGRSGLEEVKAYAARVKAKGLKVWLTVHFSDTWADPGHQTKPAAWTGRTFPILKDSLAAYMGKVASEIKPDILQIGNETNDGLLWPDGKLSTNQTNSLALFQVAIAAARIASPSSKLMMHFAGTSGSDWFFDKVKNLDFDYIGLSYYPIWHGKNLETLKTTITTLGQTYNKKVLIAETAYPFTLQWNDWTNNVVGTESQILSTYPATPEGQQQYLTNLKNLVKSTPVGLGFCYWGGEWIAFRGNQSTTGSTWENQALWNFERNALPALTAFSKN